MCYSAMGLAVANERRSGSDVRAVTVVSNSHTGLEMAKSYRGFKTSMRYFKISTKCLLPLTINLKF